MAKLKAYTIKVPISGFNIYSVIAKNKQIAKEMVLNGEATYKGTQHDVEQDSNNFEIKE